MVKISMESKATFQLNFAVLSVNFCLVGSGNWRSDNYN